MNIQAQLQILKQWIYDPGIQSDNKYVGVCKVESLQEKVTLPFF